MLRIGGAHHLRMALFSRGIRRGFIEVEEVEEAIPPGLLSAAEKWLLYFSLSSSDVELRDRSGRVVSLEDLMPEHRRVGLPGMRVHNGRARTLESLSRAELTAMLDADHFG